MNITPIDFLVIAAYLLFVLLTGFVLKRQAGQSKSDYLLGGKSIPFWMLGVSNASGMFDISGTVWMVAIMFVYGVKSIWLPWLWPVFNQIFMMVYVSAWLRKSNASTGAEWMFTRFGHGRDAGLSHKVIVVFALLSCLSFMSYGFIGLGKFLEIFIPWSSVSPFIPFEIPAPYVSHFYGSIFTLFTVFYAVMGGMRSIVLTDLVHYSIIILISISIAFIAMRELAASTGLSVPAGWTSPFFGKNLGLDWKTIIPEINKKIAADQFSPFGYFFALMAAKGILASLAGPVPNYDMQKILSTRSPREASLMSMTVNFALLPTRYLLVTGATVLGLLHYRELNIASAGGQDFEQILPAVINSFIPPGLLGLVLVGFLGSFMGNFAGTFNAAQAYFMNDVYLKSINPTAGNRQITRVSYISGLALVAVSICLGFVFEDINNTLQWIVSALYGGYIASNVLKFHWWRFNSYGFFWGMLAGILCAMICPYLFPDTVALFYFPLIFLISAAAAVIASLLTPATDIKVLQSFYNNVRPWGFWQPVIRSIRNENPHYQPGTTFGRDAFNVIFGTIGQTAITALPVFIVLLLPLPALVSACILIICILIMWLTWYRKLPAEQ